MSDRGERRREAEGLRSLYEALASSEDLAKRLGTSYWRWFDRRTAEMSPELREAELRRWEAASTEVAVLARRAGGCALRAMERATAVCQAAVEDDEIAIPSSALGDTAALDELEEVPLPGERSIRRDARRIWLSSPERCCSLLPAGVSTPLVADAFGLLRHVSKGSCAHVGPLAECVGARLVERAVIGGLLWWEPGVPTAQYTELEHAVWWADGGWLALSAAGLGCFTSFVDATLGVNKSLMVWWRGGLDASVDGLVGAPKGAKKHFGFGG